MITSVNKLSHLPATQVYVDFGLEQVEAINQRFRDWSTRQAFNETVFSEFAHMTLDGHSEYIFPAQKHPMNREFPDKVKWMLKFTVGLKNKPLDEALLYEHRYPDVVTFNSRSSIFSTANYIEIGVSNGERGWVKKGEFPANVYIGSFSPYPQVEEPRLVPVQTDIRREALAGFEIAYHWQCFRSMAAASSGLVAERLKEEFKGDLRNGPEFLREFDRRRHRVETVYPLFVNLLPNTMLEEGETALKSFYRPGVLEGELALSLGRYMHLNFYDPQGNVTRPIYTVKGSPIEIIQCSGGYNAAARFSLKMMSSGPKEDESVRQTVETRLRRHFDVELKSPTEMNVVFRLENAHRVEQAIREGATDNEVSVFARNFGDVLSATCAKLDKWYGEELPALERACVEHVGNVRDIHFLGLEVLVGKL